MIYINVRSLLSGFVLGIVAALIVLITTTMLLEPRSMQCGPDCSRDALTEISESLQESKLSVFTAHKTICLNGGQTINRDSFIQNASISSLIFKCESSVCSAGGSIDLNESGLIARTDSVFKVGTECATGATEYSCAITLYDY